MIVGDVEDFEEYAVCEDSEACEGWDAAQFAGGLLHTTSQHRYLSQLPRVDCK